MCIHAYTLFDKSQSQDREVAFESTTGREEMILAHLNYLGKYKRKICREYIYLALKEVLNK